MHSKTLEQERADAARRVALVTSGSVGWKTIRCRWERDLAYLNPTTHHIEDHARALSDFETGSVLAEARVDLFAGTLLAYVADSALVAQRGRSSRRHIETNFRKEPHMSALRTAIAAAVESLSRGARDVAATPVCLVRAP